MTAASSWILCIDGERLSFLEKLLIDVEWSWEFIDVERLGVKVESSKISNCYYSLHGKIIKNNFWRPDNFPWKPCPWGQLPWGRVEVRLV